jgi:deoxyribonuclease V
MTKTHNLIIVWLLIIGHWLLFGYWCLVIGISLDYSLKIHKLHKWNLSLKEAVSLQRRLRDRILLKNKLGSVKLIAGADMSIDDERGLGYAGVIVYFFPDLVEVERQHAKAKLNFPYVPGLLAFREAPVLIKAFAKIRNVPDVILFDGQGIAHPRGLGIASHMGLILGKPTIGCAKSRLIGEYEEPGNNVGDWSPLVKVIASNVCHCEERKRRSNLMGLLRPPKGPRNDLGAIIGAVLRTRKNVKPIFVSPGHLIDLRTSIKIVLSCSDGFRIPKPTREADHFVEQVKKPPTFTE